jgi:hypothetical protein
MNRCIAMIPVLTVVLLAACSESPVGVAAPDSPPAAAVLIGDKYFETYGGWAFTTASGCEWGDTNWTCSGEVTGTGDVDLHLYVMSHWRFTYQCVHAKTGRTSKQHPVKVLYSNKLEDEQFHAVTGSFSFSGVTIDGPAELPFNPCTGNKGQMTAVEFLSGPEKYSWDLYVENAAGWEQGYANVYLKAE